MAHQYKHMLLALLLIGSAAAWEAILSEICTRAPHVSGFAKNWCDSAVDRCQWSGVQCIVGVVISVTLIDVPLELALPIVALADDAVPNVSLIGCRISGDLGQIGTLAVRSLRLERNNFSGFLRPDSVGALMHVSLSQCGIEAEAGADALCTGAYKEVDYLDLSANSLSGDLSACRGANHFPRMRWFNMSSNLFVGRAPVPPNSVSFDVSSNGFSSLESSELAQIDIDGKTLPVMRACNITGNAFAAPPAPWTAAVKCTQDTKK